MTGSTSPKMYYQFDGFTGQLSNRRYIPYSFWGDLYALSFPLLGLTHISSPLALTAGGLGWE
jgi:hypothetical protein